MNGASGYLTGDTSAAIAALQATLPFVEAWWKGEDFTTAELDPAYAKLPELLRRLTAAPRFNNRSFAHVHPSPFIPAALASLIVSLQNPNQISEEVSTPTTVMEAECIGWMAEHLLGWPASGSWGSIVSGGTMANLTALMAARDRKPGIVIGTATTHYSVDKSLQILGMGKLVRLPIIEPGETAPYRLQPSKAALLKLLASDVAISACVLTLGTTAAGTIEYFDDETLQLLKDRGVYLHADAASGGFLFLHDDVKKRLPNLNAFDSFTLDPHKTGLVHYPCGAVIFRDAATRKHFDHNASYLGPLAPTLEGSRPGGPSAALWLTLQTLGVAGYREAAVKILAFTANVEKLLQASGLFQMLHERHTNVLSFRPRDGNSQAIRERCGPEFKIGFDRNFAGMNMESLRIVVTNPQANDAQELVDTILTPLPFREGLGEGSSFSRYKEPSPAPP